MKHAPALALIAALVSACGVAPARPAQVRVDFAPIARSVELCRTTLAGLKQRLGEPDRDGLLHGQQVVSWIASVDPLVRYLAVLVDDRGVVTDLYWNIPSEVPWTPTDQCTRR